LAVLGLAFKGDTDDIRESPAIAIIEALLKEGAQVRVYDPAATSRAKEVLPMTGVVYTNDPYDAAADSDALLILTEWKQFAKLDLLRMHSALKYPIVLDGRNLYDADEMAKAGLIYYSVGRATGVPQSMTSMTEHVGIGLHIAPQVNIPTAAVM
jgi:UDPglucose 6-dehydrogenase